MKLTLKQVFLYLSETDKQGNRVTPPVVAVAKAAKEEKHRREVQEQMRESLKKLGIF